MEKPLEQKKPTIQQDIRRLIAENRLEQALDMLRRYTSDYGLSDLHNRVILQAGKWEQYAVHTRQGTIDYDDLTRTHANISLALLDLVKELPDASELPEKKKPLQGIREGRLKFQIMWALLIGKVFVFGYLVTVMQAGDIPFKGFLLIAGVIFPNFASHLSTILQERLSKKYSHGTAKSKRINRGIQWTTYFVVALYLLGLFLILEFYLAGGVPRVMAETKDGIEVATFENLLLLLALIESSLGVYVGSVIHNLFKNKD